ncbi:MAG: hypothetical protein ABJB16_07965 [Saprospiraceae bacterium]
MPNNEQAYIDTLKKSVYDRISADINDKTIDEIVKTDLVKSHLDNKASASFQSYYFLTLDNEKLYFRSADFFRKFKKQYSLQGMDNNYLDKLEGLKKEILKKIRADKLVHLYFDIFNKAVIKHGQGFKEKDLGSFFAKLVHTFRPHEYCALDNPIKNYFGLKKESFFISFFIISVEYKHWATVNKKLLNTIKEKLKGADKKGILQHDKITDLKLLDLIFWSKANRNNKKKAGI